MKQHSNPAVRAQTIPIGPERNPRQAALTRRSALKIGIGSILAGMERGGAAQGAAGNKEDATMEAKAEAAVRMAHETLWERFFDAQDVMLDYVSEDGLPPIPTPEECRQGKPNALGWWTPIENGAMFNGLYMDAAIGRWRASGSEADAEKVRRLARGSMRLAACSEVKGFIGRGFAADGATTWPMGSNDQTLPWLYGLWRYLQTGIPDAAERAGVAAAFIATVETIAAANWRMPAEPPFLFRGSFNGYTWGGAPRLLFVTRAMRHISGEAKWDDLYEAALGEKPAKGGPTRFEACEGGMVFKEGVLHSWTGAVSAVALRGLWEMEENEERREAYARGLEASARLALQSLPIAESYDNGNREIFEPDWRVLNRWWKPQSTEDEAGDLARIQLKEINRLSPRRNLEMRAVREPVFAAWVVSLAPDRNRLRERAEALYRALAHYRYERLFYSQFFPAESAWWRLQATD
ncbi:MAG: hypothetical protein BWZ10_01455 [candidate division BRC1 bacterium ADurb.BinA364]|nr:MAG: hypothetical protein BWZ10_01455 [candidate division BRC1 bacterium ADurb.BinA364]